MNQRYSAEKRDSRRHSTTSFQYSENVVVLVSFEWLIRQRPQKLGSPYKA